MRRMASPPGRLGDTARAPDASQERGRHQPLAAAVAPIGQDTPVPPSPQ
jgi:hypothetical protein